MVPIRNRNRNLSKVGTGTRMVINSYGSAKLLMTDTIPCYCGTFWYSSGPDVFFVADSILQWSVYFFLFSNHISTYGCGAVQFKAIHEFHVPHHAVLRIRIRDPVPFWPLDPGSGIGFFRIPDLGSRIPNPYFWEFRDNCLGKKFYNSLKIGLNFFLQYFKTKILYNFVKFVAT